MTCIQIIRDKYKIETEVYTEELRSEHMIKLKREKKHNKKYSVAHY